MGKGISYGFILEAHLKFLENPMLGVSVVSCCVYFWEEFLE